MSFDYSLCLSYLTCTLKSENVNENEKLDITKVLDQLVLAQLRHHYSLLYSSLLFFLHSIQSRVPILIQSTENPKSIQTESLTPKMASTSSSDPSVDPSKVVLDLSESTSTPSSLRPIYTKLISQYNRKLWYQLTQTLEELVKHPEARNSPKDLINLYHGFVSTFQKKLSQNSLVNIAVIVARGYSGE